MRDQLSENYDWFLAKLPELLASYRGQHALIHDKEIAGIFPTSLDAVMTGLKRFGEDNFSVEAVDDQIEDLGFYSHVSAALRA
ncbi:MAG: hypothetical protein R3E02_12305 [Blastomonas sp.]